MKIEKFKRCILLDYNFGFLGETYLEKEKMKECQTKIIEKYFSIKEPYYCNRNSHYYETNVKNVLKYISEYTTDINELIQSNTEHDLKRYLIFSIVSHLINDTTKLIGIVFAYSDLRKEFLEPLKSFLQYCTDYFVRIIFQEDIVSFEKFDENILERLNSSISLIDDIEARQYSEMDHSLILVKSFFVYEEYFKGLNGIVAPLQGASFIPPMYISLLKYIKSEEAYTTPKTFDYLRLSNYDNSHYLDTSVDNQVADLSSRYDTEDRLLLIDDNTGTATTIKGLKKELEVCFKNIITCVVECRWDTKLYNMNYSAFSMNDVDIITPLEYRHYKRFEEEINHMMTKPFIHEIYNGGNFYESDYIYNHIDFEKYLDTSEIKVKNKQRLLDITSKYKYLQLQCTTYNTTSAQGFTQVLEERTDSY